MRDYNLQTNAKFQNPTYSFWEELSQMKCTKFHVCTIYSQLNQFVWRRPSCWKIIIKKKQLRSKALKIVSMEYARMKHFPVASLNLPISDSERSRDIIMDIKFHSVRDRHGSKGSLILRRFCFCRRKTSSQPVHRVNRDVATDKSNFSWELKLPANVIFFTRNSKLYVHCR